MSSVILIKSADAGKRALIAEALVKKLKKEMGRTCMYINEDDFLRKMQTKYSAIDTAQDINSSEVIKVVIPTLLRLDRYEIILIEGSFRLKDVTDNYRAFCKQYKHKFVIVEFGANENAIKNSIKIDEAKNPEDIAEEIIPRFNLK